MKATRGRDLSSGIRGAGHEPAQLCCTQPAGPQLANSGPGPTGSAGGPGPCGMMQQEISQVDSKTPAGAGALLATSEPELHGESLSPGQEVKLSQEIAT